MKKAIAGYLGILLLLVMFTNPLTVFAVSYPPAPLYHQQAGEEVVEDEDEDDRIDDRLGHGAADAARAAEKHGVRHSSTPQHAAERRDDPFIAKKSVESHRCFSTRFDASRSVKVTWMF